MRDFSRQRAIGGAIAAVLLLALGAGLIGAAPRWAPLFGLLLPFVVVALTLFTGRVVAMGGGVLAVLFLLPGLLEAFSSGDIPGVIYNLLIALLCLLVGGGRIILDRLGQLRERLDRSLGDWLSPTVDTSQSAMVTDFRARQIEESAVLAEITQTIGSSLDLTDTLASILTSIRRLISFDMGEITLWDSEGQCLVSQGALDAEAYHAEVGQVYQIGEGYSGWLAQHRRPLLIEDTRSYEEVRPKLDRPDSPLRSYLGIPLASKGDFVGTLELISNHPAAFTARDVEMLESVGQQAAVAIENARLYEETQRRAAELSSLAEVSSAIISTLDREEVLDTIANSVLDLTGCQQSAIFVLDEEQDVLELAATRGLSEEYVAQSQLLPVSEGGRSHAVASGRPLIVEDTGAAPNFKAYAPLAEKEGFAAFADLPLRAGDKIVGMLSALFTSAHHFTALERDILAALADQAAVAIENARLYSRVDQELRRRAVALAGLQRIARELSTTFDQDHILRLVVEEALLLSKANRAAIILQEPGQDWRLTLCSGYLEEEQAALRRYLRTSFEETPIGEVARTGRSLEVDISAEQFVVDGWTPTQSALLVPVWYGDAPTAVIMLESVEAEFFDEDMQGFIDGLAAQAAVAIGNARRYQEEMARSELLRQRADQLRNILEVSRAIRSDQPLPEVLEDIAYAVQESVEFDVVLINILEGDPGYLQRVASAGVPLDVFERLQQTPQPWAEWAAAVMTDEFRISQSYYVPAEYEHRWRGVIDTYEVVNGSDVEREPGVWHPHDILVVPLLGPEGEVRGTFSVDAPRDGKVPTREVIEVLEVFAAQAAVAIENARLVEALQRRLELLTFFNELNRSVTAKQDLGEVLDTVVEATARLVNCDGTVFFLMDEASQKYVPMASYGHSLEALEEATFASGDGLVGRAASSGMPLNLADVASEPEQRYYIDSGATLLIPLDIGGEVAGVLTVDREQTETFSPTDVATLIALADQVALAVQSARLFNEALQRTNELSTLLEANSAISSTLDLKWMLQALGDRLLGVTGAERCHLSEWDREKDLVTVVWEVGEMDLAHSRVGADFTAQERPSAMTEVLLIQEPLTLEAEELWEGLEAEVHEQETGLVLLLPMVARGRTVGLVELEQLAGSQAFASEEIRLAQALANQAAVAIENAQLFEKTRRFSEELEQRVEERTEELAEALEELTVERDRVEALYRIASELSSSLDMDQILNRTLEMVAEVVEAPQGTILLRDLETDRLFCRAIVGTGDSLPPGGIESDLPRGQGLGWWVITHGESVIVEDLKEDPRWMPGEKVRDLKRRACLAIPLGTAGEVQGTLILYHNEPGFFTVDHLRLVEATGSQISNTISNAALYNLIRDQAEQLGSMLKQQRVEAAKSQAILEAVADGVMVADAQGRVILFNAAAEHVLDIRRQNVLGRSTKEMLGLYGAEGRSWMSAIDEWAADPGERTPGDFAAEQIQLGEKIVSIHVAPVIMGKEYLGTVSVFRDITVVVEADRAKSEFVSTVSHELRTPMTSIKGYADLLLMGAVGELGEQQLHFINIIRNNADRLTALVNDLLDISRIESGRIELSFNAVPISEVIDMVINTLHGRAEERELALIGEVAEGLPAVWGDKHRITQVLTNLVGNAIQYTPSGGSITVSTRVNEEEMLEVAVIDTGIGISKENMKKIFERFFRVDDPLVQETSGTGLGLAITAKLVHMHGGEIWVESELGEGSTFYFSLPLARVVSGEDDGEMGSRVLVVEDDPEVAELLRLGLEDQGHKVFIAGRGDEAVRLAEEIVPSLIALDIHLPDGDGFSVMRQLKESPSSADIPIYITPVMNGGEDLLRLGAVGYLAKPVHEVELRDTVDLALDGREGGKILVVTADREDAEVVNDVLQEKGLDVVSVRRGERAVHVAQEVEPDLILIDMSLEDVGGYEVLRAFKSDVETQDIPIIVVTGNLTQEEVNRDLMALGARRFLDRPFAVHEFAEEISAAMGYPEAQRE